MIALGFELPGPPPTKKEIRQWKKWQKEMKKLWEADLSGTKSPLAPSKRGRKASLPLQKTSGFKKN
ncbi:MAG: hypothetical protein HY840_11210 [Bacteroidetes bacterium]|nr:hypothetical protein [Bacteroidota bacterium]